MREIGSEFWDVPVRKGNNTLFPESAQWYLSGRCALQAIIRSLPEVKSVSMPSWCCGSLVKPFIDAGFAVDFYPVLFDKELVQEINLKSDVLFLLDYFGYGSSNVYLAEYKGKTIRDITHSTFSMNHADADYYFGSLRKLCGIWTGGYAWVNDGSPLEPGSQTDNRYVCMRERAMIEKAEYICKKRNDKGYLKLYAEAENYLNDVEIQQAAERDVSLAHILDIEEIRCKRRANATVLMSAFPDWLIFPVLNDTDCPVFVPILVPDGKRDELRRYLIMHEIYCPIHWPVSRYHRLDEKSNYIYQNELSLICDQRYTEDDMKRIVETISAFWKEVHGCSLSIL